MLKRAKRPLGRHAPRSKAHGLPNYERERHPVAAAGATQPCQDEVEDLSAQSLSGPRPAPCRGACRAPRQGR
eukprot:3568454-Pyramimonas_sp.AAC.1